TTGFLFHRLDSKAVASVCGQRPHHAIEDERSADQDVHQAPVPDEGRVAREVDPCRELVAEGQHHGQVRVEMDEVPGLVREAPPCNGDRKHYDRDEEPQRDDRGKQALIAGYEVGQLTGEVLAVTELV